MCSLFISRYQMCAVGWQTGDQLPPTCSYATAFVKREKYGFIRRNIKKFNVCTYLGLLSNYNCFETVPSNYHDLLFFEFLAVNRWNFLESYKNFVFDNLWKQLLYEFFNSIFVQFNSNDCFGVYFSVCCSRSQRSTSVQCVESSEKHPKPL